MAIRKSGGFGRKCCAYVVAACLLQASPITAYGRLGETAQACVERYGKPIAVTRGDKPVNGVLGGVFFPRPSMDFKTESLIVRCFYSTAEPTAVCEEIVYTAAVAVNWDVFEHAMEVNSQGSQWGESETVEGTNLGTVTRWKRNDGASAEYSRIGGLWIRSRELNKEFEQQDKRDLDRKTRGL